MIALGVTAYSQSNSKLHQFGEQKLNRLDYNSDLVLSKGKPVLNNQEKALNVIWTEDFSGSVALQTANGDYAVTGTTGSYWTLSSSTTHPLGSLSFAMNGRHLRWDSYTPNSAETAFASTPVDGEIVSPAIDCSGLTNSIGIQFITQTTYCCNASYKPYSISVSTDDGATWSAPLSIGFGYDRNQPTEYDNNPLVFSANLSSIAGPLTANTRFKFSWDGLSPDINGQFNTHYYWMIDDIEVYEIPNYDGELTEIYWGVAGLKYYQIPLTQVAPIDFSTKVNNVGAADLTNVQFNLDVNTGAFTSSSAGVTINPGAQDSLFSDQYNPSANGVYDITRTLTSNEVDDIPTNNVFAPLSIEVNDFIYARDNGVLDGWTSSNGTAPFETGNYYDCYTDATVYGLDVILASSSPTNGSEFAIKIYRFNPAGTSYFEYMEYMMESLSIQTAPGMNNTVLRIPFISPVNLTAGETYYVVVESYTGDLRIATAGTTDGNAIIYYSDVATAYNQPKTPVIRMDFDPTGAWLGLDENETVTGLNIFPNPSVNEATVAFNLESASEVTINVTDIAGKVVESIELGNSTVGKQSITLNTAKYTAGIYNVTITTGESKITKKLIKK